MSSNESIIRETPAFTLIRTAYHTPKHTHTPTHTHTHTHTQTHSIDFHFQVHKYSHANPHIIDILFHVHSMFYNKIIGIKMLVSIPTSFNVFSCPFIAPS